MAIRTPYPLMPGMKLIVMASDPQTPSAPAKQLELQVLTCSPWLGAYRIRARILRRQAPATPRLAA